VALSGIETTFWLLATVGAAPTRLQLAAVREESVDSWSTNPTAGAGQERFMPAEEVIIERDGGGVITIEAFI
jgi:hypothetical protein